MVAVVLVASRGICGAGAGDGADAGHDQPVINHSGRKGGAWIGSGSLSARTGHDGRRRRRGCYTGERDSLLNENANEIG